MKSRLLAAIRVSGLALSKRLACVVFSLLSVTYSASAVLADEVSVLAPTAFVRGTGKPIVDYVDFPSVAGPATLRVANAEAGVRGVTSATVSLNGEVVFDVSDFPASAPPLEATVELNGGGNELAVTVGGKPNSTVMVSIVRDANALDEASAKTFVRDVILPREIPAVGPYSAMVIPGVLAAGTPVYEGGPGAATANLDIRSVGDYYNGRLPAVTATEDSYLFFLDLAPQTYYEHPVKYILVGKSGGFQVTEARWWPVVNGRMPPELIPKDPDPQLIIEERDVWHGAAASAALDYVVPFCDDCVLELLTREGFIVVQGLLPNEKLIDDASLTLINGVFFFSGYINTYLENRGRLRALAGADADDVLNEIDTMAGEERNVITLYIIAHGGSDNITLGGVKFTAQQFRNKFDQYPDIQFNLLLGSCNSGSFIDNLQTLPNVAVVGTAVANGEGATPDWDNKDGVPWDLNIYDVGSEWTSSVLHAGRALLSDTAKVQSIDHLADLAGVPMTSMLIYQSLLGATGDNPPFAMVGNLDLSNRLSQLNATTYGPHNPQIYRSW